MDPVTAGVTLITFSVILTISGLVTSKRAQRIKRYTDKANYVSCTPDELSVYYLTIVGRPDDRIFRIDITDSDSKLLYQAVKEKSKRSFMANGHLDRYLNFIDSVDKKEKALICTNKKTVARNWISLISYDIPTPLAVSIQPSISKSNTTAGTKIVPVINKGKGNIQSGKDPQREKGDKETKRPAKDQPIVKIYDHSLMVSESQGQNDNFFLPERFTRLEEQYNNNEISLCKFKKNVYAEFKHRACSTKEEDFCVPRYRWVCDSGYFERITHEGKGYNELHERIASISSADKSLKHYKVQANLLSCDPVIVFATCVIYILKAREDKRRYIFH